MAMLKMLDPRATVNPEDRPLVPGLDSLEGKVIGIIDNGQSNSTTMFQELAKLMREKFQTAKWSLRRSLRICRARPNRSWRKLSADVMR